jgi:hypothetical protein
VWGQKDACHRIYTRCGLYLSTVSFKLLAKITIFGCIRRLCLLLLQEFPDAYFYHASEQYASLLHDMGYFINDVGAETTLQVRIHTESMHPTVQ